MTRIDDVFEHRVFRERAVVTKSAEDTRGDFVRLEFYLAPRQSVSVEHMHPVQKEHLAVLSGEIRVRVNGTERTVGLGQKAEIPSRARHAYWNAGDEEAVVQVEFRPALQTEGFIEAFYTLARAGKVSPKTGLPGTIEMGALLHRYRDEIRLVLMPEPIQSAVFAGLASAGKLLEFWTRLRRLQYRAVRLRARRA
jgi:quercetin dioxygenase-like cupin family protein